MEPVPVNQARVSHEGPPGEGGCSRGQDEHPKRQLAAGDEVVASRCRQSRATNSPEDTIAPVEHDEHEQPDNLRRHTALPCSASGSVPVGLPARLQDPTPGAPLNECPRTRGNDRRSAELLVPVAEKTTRASPAPPVKADAKLGAERARCLVIVRLRPPSPPRGRRSSTHSRLL